MAPRFGISRHDLLRATFSDLTPDERDLLSALLSAQDHPSRPGFELTKPGSLTLFGTPKLLRHFAMAVSADGRLPDRIADRLRSRVENYLAADFTMPVGDRALDLGSRTHIMGILNVTPDSFSDGGRFSESGRAVLRGREMIEQGADIIDIGGESTRPGSEPVTEDDELRRIIPVIEALSRDLSIPISVDTYKAGVARKALAAGATIVNDIGGLRFSPDMASVVADHGAAVIIMHIKGTPRDMQANPVYDDVVAEVTEHLAEGIEIALRAGVARNKILIDPGIGFGKTAEHNLLILNRLDEFRVLGRPIVLGTSRKRFIGSVLNIPDPVQRIEGTAATVALGIERGARVVRVHDVAAMTKVARMTDAMVRASTK